MRTLSPPTIESIRSACNTLAGTILRTPLIPLYVGGVSGEIYLKLENLQPTGSFKVRGAGNALHAVNPDQLTEGVWTASAGNMGQALAWYANRLNVSCTVLVPDDAPEVKVHGIERMGGKVVKAPFNQYQSVQKEGTHPGMKGLFVHPFANEAVLAGNGTIGLEILEDLPDVDMILAPYGGGGLSCGIAASLANQQQVKVEAVEVENATPLTVSLAAGKMVETPYQPSFVTGMGAPFVFPQMWPLASQFLAGSHVVGLKQVADAIRLLVMYHHIVSEGAGAAAVAAALAMNERKKVVCVVSGGNINAMQLNKILMGDIP